MDCRRFHRNLEDYLEDGLDFSGRFGMERHAQQCISCGKDLAGAQRLRRIVRELDRTKAPSNFESMLLNEIGRRKSGRFSNFRRYWLYGFELPSVRKLALASSALAVLAFAAFYFSPSVLSRRAAPEISSAPLVVAQDSARNEIKQSPQPPVVPVAATRTNPTNLRKPAESAGTIEAPTPISTQDEIAADAEAAPEADYVELQWIGPDNRPVSSVRWPSKRNQRNGQSVDEFFIRNVSH